MQSLLASQSTWLRSYYVSRAVFSIAWVAAAVLLSAEPTPRGIFAGDLSGMGRHRQSG